MTIGLCDAEKIMEKLNADFDLSAYFHITTDLFQRYILAFKKMFKRLQMRIQKLWPELFAKKSFYVVQLNFQWTSVGFHHRRGKRGKHGRKIFVRARCVLPVIIENVLGASSSRGFRATGRIIYNGADKITDHRSKNIPA